MFILKMTALEYGAWLALLLFSIVSHVNGDSPPYPMSESELLVAAGFYDKSGKYLGGYPQFHEVSNMNQCTEYNSSVCTTWETKSSLTDEEYVECACDAQAGNAYCDTWTCSMVRKNPSADCTYGCSIITWYGTATCECSLSVLSGNYCAEWACGESPPEGGYSEVTYLCASSSASQEYCNVWTWEFESSGELEVAACECLEEQEEGGCLYWECSEKSIDKCGGTCDVRVAVGVSGTLGLIGCVLLYNAVRDGGVLCSLFFVLWVLGAAGTAVYWGGQDGAIYVGVMWMGLGILKAIFWFCRTKEER